jgi:hypothetical protein
VTIDATAELLARVFPHAPRISRPDYLRWLYLESPFGRVVETNLDDEQGRAGHYALVPIALVDGGGPCAGALSLNTAVDERARGGGAFVRLATETIAAARAAGIQAVVGVANANSTPGFLRRLEFELAMPLPATVLLPAPGPAGGVRSAWASDGAFAKAALETDAGRLFEPPPSGLARAWTAETLRWRLAAPGASYALHRMEGSLAISTVDRRHGVPVAVLLKVFAAAPLDGRARRALVRAACRFHRAPIALHVGVNDRVAFRGVPLPERLRDSPLNLIHRRLDDGPAHAQFARFEMLDFDAY